MSALTKPPYPVFKLEVIVKCLGELNITTTKDEIAFPEKNVPAIRKILLSLADWVLPPKHTEQHQIIHHDYFTTSSEILQSFRSCYKMMELCAFHDFCFRDYNEPTAKRLKFQLSAVLNYAMFRMTTEQKFSSLQEAIRKDSESLHVALQQHMEIESELDNARRKDISEGSIKDLEAECDELQARLDEEAAKHIQIEEEILEEEEKICKQSNRKIKELNLWIEQMKITQKIVNEAVENVTSVRTEVNRQRELLDELEIQRQKVVSTRVALSEMEQNAKQANRAATRAEERLRSLREQIQQRSLQSQHAMDKLHKDIVAAETYTLEVNSKAEQHEEEVMQLDQQLLSESRAYQQEIQDITTSYQKVEKVVVQHLQELQNMMTIVEAQKQPL